jgi:redox-sensitive bicupin YhaK (pirin superfamily)
MTSIRKSNQRGHADHGWLDTYHTFSFASYYDPRNMGFRSLRVINEDRVAPRKGFGMHPHDNMEILTYVLKGQLAHKDTMGEQQVLGPNEIQKMSAGTGILHSEFNASAEEPVHLLQIWIEPNRQNVTPSYEQFAFAPEEKLGKWRLLASPDAANGDPVARLNQDARVYVGAVSGEEKLQLPLATGRGAWLHVVNGDVVVNGRQLSAGDAAAVENESQIEVAANGTAGEVLVFDLA